MQHDHKKSAGPSMSALAVPFLAAVVGAFTGCRSGESEPVNEPGTQLTATQILEKYNNRAELIMKLDEVFEATTPAERAESERLLRDAIELASANVKEDYRQALREELKKHEQKCRRYESLSIKLREEDKERGALIVELAASYFGQ
jgi:hypothetical protein